MQIRTRLRGPTRLLGVLAAGGLVVCANGSAGPKLEEGPNAEVTVDGLHKVVGSAFRNAWVKPDIDLSSYDAVLIEAVEISYRRQPRRTQSRYGSSNGNFALTDGQMQKMKSLFGEVFVAELEKSSHFRLTDTPGSSVLRLVPSIIDLRIDVPTERAAGRDDVFATSVGKMTLILELYDSQSGEILARVADRREARLAGGFELRRVDRISGTDAIRRVFRSWAGILRRRLDALHELDLSTVSEV